MIIENFVGKVVRLLWCDIPYVGFLLTIQNDKYIVLTDCKRYSNLKVCFDGRVHTTNQKVDFFRLTKTEVQWMTTFWRDFVQVRAEFNNCAPRKLERLFQIQHCHHCFKPHSMVPINQEGAAMYTLLGNQDVVLPDNLHVMQEFIENLPNNCMRCLGGNLSAINGRFLNPFDPAVPPMQQNNPPFQQVLQLLNARLMDGIPQGLNLGLPPILPYIGIDNDYPVQPPVPGFGINPLPYYNPPIVQAFPNNMFLEPGNLNNPNPICGYPNCTNRNNIEMEYSPPWHFPHPNSNGCIDDDEEDDPEDEKEDDEENGEADDEDEEDAEPTVVIPNVQEVRPELPPLPPFFEINVDHNLHDRG